MKLFDTVNYDVIHYIRLGFSPGVCDFVSKVSDFSPTLAIAEIDEADGASTGNIRLVKAE